MPEWELAQTEGFEPSVTHGWATPAKMRNKCCYGQKNLGQNNSLSPSPTHLSHTTNITLSRIKCERLYFYKDVYSFVHWSSYIMFDYVPHIFIVVYVCEYTAQIQTSWTIIIIIISFFFFFFFFFTLVLTDGFFYWSLSDSKSPPVSRTLLRTLTDFRSAVVWKISILPLISKGISEV